MQSFGLDGEMVPDFSAVYHLYSSLRHGKNISSILGDNIPMILGIIARCQRFFPSFFLRNSSEFVAKLTPNNDG